MLNSTPGELFAPENSYISYKESVTCTESMCSFFLLNLQWFQHYEVVLILLRHSVYVLYSFAGIRLRLKGILSGFEKLFQLVMLGTAIEIPVNISEKVTN